jgi:hypothetical protein
MKKEQKNENVNQLSDGAVMQIASILSDVWEMRPSQKAAVALRSAGFTAHDLWLFGKTVRGRLQPDEWRNNTYNDMRDYEVSTSGR